MKTTNLTPKPSKSLIEYTKEELVNECLTLQEKVKDLAQKQEWLIEQIRLANQKKFGSSSEKTEYPDGYEQICLAFNEAEKFADTKVKEPEFEEVTIKRKKTKGKREADLAGLETEIIEYTLPIEGQVCPNCEQTLHVMSKEVRKELVVIPRHLKVVEHVSYIYACRNCEKNDITTPIIKAPAPKPVIKGSVASPSLVALVMENKYVNALPLHRQEKDFDTYGIVLPKQNLANWMIKSANDWLLPIYQKVKKALLQETVIHCDETVVQVLREPNRKAESNSYMWLYRSCEASVPKVIFEYQETRSSSHPKRFFDGYQGYIHCDGYSGYHNLPGEITVVGCLAHARRKFDECIKSLSKEEQKTTKAWEALEFCRILFDIEERLKDCTPEERYAKRLELSQPILDAFLAWLEKTAPCAAPKSALGKAIYYTLAQWKYLKNYLLDGRLVLSNNLAERSIRPFVQGRKNWMFCNTPKGATTSAIIYSIILTAQENGLVARQYLTYLFEQLPNLSFKEDPQLLADYLPWSDKLPEWCKKESK